MTARALEPPWVQTPDGLYRAQNVSYGIHVNLDEGLPSPNPMALHKADFCLEFNGRKIEKSWDEMIRLLKLKQ